MRHFWLNADRPASLRPMACLSCQASMSFISCFDSTAISTHFFPPQGMLPGAMPEGKQILFLSLDYAQVLPYDAIWHPLATYPYNKGADNVEATWDLNDSRD